MEPHTWKLEWSDAMSVGIPEIDEDHKRFIFLIDKLNRAIAGRLGQDEIKARLQLILDDAAQHFAHEEKLLKKWKYPDTDDHADKHADATKALQALMERFINYGLPSEWIDVGLEVKNILIDHLLTEDMKYAEFYRNSGEVRGKQ